MSWNLINVVGKVTDAETGAPLQGVTVEKLSFGKETGQFVATDPAGLFNIPVVGFNGLKFTHVGYQTEIYQDAQLFSGTNNIAMVKSSTVLPEIVITAVKKNWLMWAAIGGAVLYYGYKKKWFK